MGITVNNRMDHQLELVMGRWVEREQLEGKKEDETGNNHRTVELWKIQGMQKV